MFFGNLRARDKTICNFFFLTRHLYSLWTKIFWTKWKKTHLWFKTDDFWLLMFDSYLDTFFVFLPGPPLWMKCLYLLNGWVGGFFPHSSAGSLQKYKYNTPHYHKFVSICEITSSVILEIQFVIFTKKADWLKSRKNQETMIPKDTCDSLFLFFERDHMILWPTSGARVTLHIAKWAHFSQTT
jgi:hypothetical protein